MKEEEIEHLTKLQSRINQIKGMIEKTTRGISLYCDSESIHRGSFPELYTQARELMLDHLNELLADLTYQRDNLVICRGEAEYKPIDILNNQIG